MIIYSAGLRKKKRFRFHSTWLSTDVTINVQTGYGVCARATFADAGKRVDDVRKFDEIVSAAVLVRGGYTTRLRRAERSNRSREMAA